MSFRFHSTPAIIPILRKSLHWRSANDLIITKEVVEVAIAAGEYESILKKTMEFVEDSAQRYKIHDSYMEPLLNYATQAQLEKIVLPFFFPFFEKQYDYSDFKIFQAMPIIFNKLSPERLKKILPKLFEFLSQGGTTEDHVKLLHICIEKMDADVVEKAIVLELFKLCDQSHPNILLVKSIINELLAKCIEKMDAAAIEEKIVPNLLKLSTLNRLGNSFSALLLKCIDKMSTDAIKRILQINFESQFFNFEIADDKKDQNYYLKMYERDVVFAPYLALISRFNKEENDRISESLLKHVSVDLRDDVANDILTCLKELRHKNIYVNDVLFDAVQAIIYERNEKYLKTNDYSRLLVSHLTLEQVTRIVEDENLASKLKKKNIYGQDLDLTLFEKFSALPIEIYPIQLRITSLKFIRKHLDHQYSIWSLIKCLKVDAFSDAEFQNILNEFAQFALNNMQAICHVEEQKKTEFEKKILSGTKITMENFREKPVSKIDIYHYCKLLETCTSIMTDDVLDTYILPKIRQMLKVSDNGELHIDSIDTDIFPKINECLKLVFLKINNNDVCREFFNYFYILYINKGACGELLPILTSKVDLNTLGFAYRKILHSNHSDYIMLDRNAYFLALVSNRISNQTNECHPAEIKEGKEENERQVIKKSKRSCSLM